MCFHCPARRGGVLAEDRQDLVLINRALIQVASVLVAQNGTLVALWNPDKNTPEENSEIRRSLGETRKELKELLDLLKDLAGS
jgi:hypothetical protein